MYRLLETLKIQVQNILSG